MATLSCDEANFLKMAAGALDPTKAFMTGKLKIKGDMTMGKSQTFFLIPKIFKKKNRKNFRKVEKICKNFYFKR